MNKVVSLFLAGFFLTTLALGAQTPPTLPRQPLPVANGWADRNKFPQTFRIINIHGAGKGLAYSVGLMLDAGDHWQTGRTFDTFSDDAYVLDTASFYRGRMTKDEIEVPIRHSDGTIDSVILHLSTATQGQTPAQPPAVVPPFVPAPQQTRTQTPPPLENGWASDDEFPVILQVGIIRAVPQRMFYALGIMEWANGRWQREKQVDVWTDESRSSLELRSYYRARYGKTRIEIPYKDAKGKTHTLSLHPYEER